MKLGGWPVEGKMRIESRGGSVYNHISLCAVCHYQHKENNFKRIIRAGSQPQELWKIKQFDYDDKTSLKQFKTWCGNQGQLWKIVGIF